MIKKQEDEDELTERQLRIKAKIKLANISSPSLEDYTDTPPEQLLHELQVHQIELEMQNEELRRAQVALEESHDRYVDLYEFAPVGYLTLNADSTIAEANLTVATMLGVERSKLIHRRFAQFLIPEDRELWYAHFLSTKQLGERQQCELTIRHADGSCLCMHVDSRRIEVDYAPTVLRITLTDISDRKHIEDTLRDRESQLALILNGAELATWDWDIKTGRVMFNERWASMRGYQLEEIKPNINFWKKSIFPADLLRVQNAINEHFEGHTPFFTVEYRARNKKGAWIWIMNRSTAIQHNEDGQPQRMTGIELNITPRKLAEERLRIAAAAFETQAGIIVTDSHKHIMCVNKAFTGITGYDEKEVIGKNLSFLHSGLHSEEFYRNMWKDLVRNHCWQGEIWDKRNDGELFPVYLAITAVADTEGHITHYVGSFTDITAQKQAEKVLLEARQQLENQVASTQEELEKIKEDSAKINTALNVLLKHRETDKCDAQGTLAREMAGTVLPFLKRLKKISNDKNQSRLLEVLEDNLQQLVQFYGRDTRLSSVYQKLTPAEIQVASMVRQGLSTKVIATTLRLSVGTVGIHRKHIRKKLDLDSKAINLYSYLVSLTE